MSVEHEKRAPIVIREARAGDAAQLAAWAIAMALETEEKKLDSETIKRGVRGVLDDAARGRYFIADRVHDGVAMAIGTLMVTLEWSDWRCGDWWWIQSVYVAPEYRRRGVYGALHNHVRTLAEADPLVCGLRLYVERDNLDAQRTYKAMGMHDAGYRVYEGEFAKARG
ncbi:MAG: GNAT family N-acetyltransferase [Lysobacteraceae bacterium]